jgi:hypothetical protein
LIYFRHEGSGFHLVFLSQFCATAVLPFAICRLFWNVLENMSQRALQVEQICFDEDFLV